MCFGIHHQKAGLILGFVPLIVYGLLAGTSAGSVDLALGAAAAVTVIAGYADLRRGMILMWATLLLFGSLFIAVAILGIAGIIPWIGVITYTVLAAAAFGSILAKMPFTLQYAREMVDRSLWEKPEFIRVNVLMTGVWGGVFAICLVISYALTVVPVPAGTPASLLTYLALAAGIAFTLWYPGHVRRKYRV